MRIAVPIWDDRVSPVLDTASRLLIVDIKDHKADASFETRFEDQDFPQRCLRIQGMGVDVLICGGVSRPFLRMLMASGMEIIPGVSGNPDDILAAYLSGTIHQQEFLMPGFKRNKFGQRNGLSTGKMKCRSRKKRGKKNKEEKMEKTIIAVPTAGGKLCAHFGHCEQFALIETENGKIKNETFHTPPPHEPGVLPKWLHEQGANVIIAGGMGGRAQNLFSENGIQVITGALEESPESLVNQYLSNTLVTGDNVCDH